MSVRPPPVSPCPACGGREGRGSAFHPLLLAGEGRVGAPRFTLPAGGGGGWGACVSPSPACGGGRGGVFAPARAGGGGGGGGPPLEQIAPSGSLVCGGREENQSVRLVALADH